MPLPANFGLGSPAMSVETFSRDGSAAQRSVGEDDEQESEAKGLLRENLRWDFLELILPPKDLKVHSETPVTHMGTPAV